ncbi:MAG: hypothetical protein IIC74_06760 [Bacteroidetes bacterium]|nr:hypothetical protein [Bacteroidota bacterium]
MKERGHNKHLKKLARDKKKSKAVDKRATWIPPAERGPTFEEFKARADEIKREGKETSWMRYAWVRFKLLIKKLWHIK